MRDKPYAGALLILVLVIGLAASAAAEPIRLMSPLEKLENVQGSAVVRKTGHSLVVILPGQDGGDRWFRVETSKDGASQLPSGFRSDDAQVHYWMGHLVLIANGSAWHFSVPGLDKFLSKAAETPDSAELASLVSGYQVKEVQVSAIYSASGPRARHLNDGLGSIFENIDDQQDIGNGLGSCGSTCSITCGDGSSCSATCGSNRCARCSCPASCSCS